MKTLVLAEKPSVAKDIARVLRCNGGSGYMEGPQYVVTWALGHLVTLADPEAYGEEYKTWKLDNLPILPAKMELVVIKQTSKQYGIVKNLLKRSDINEIVIATDAGREGELVARWILEKSGVKKPIKRLWVSSVTDKALRDGFSHLKNGAEYNNLYQSAQARAIADWIVGINGTRALTTKYNAQLSCGRVQTPTLAIIKSVEDEIKTFRPQKFYGITATSENILFTWHDKKSNNTRIFDKEECDKLISTLQNKPLSITDIQKQNKKIYPPKLYDLTELQREANNRYGYSAKETLNIMQQLYETHKILTYPRTDSRYLSTDIVPTIPERLKAIAIGDYARLVNKINKNTIRGNDNYVDNKKVSDHHAIIPTEEPVFINKLNEKERKIYNLVIQRFLSVLFPPCEYEEMTIRASIGSEVFLARGKRIISAGFKEITGTNEKDDDDEKEMKDQVLSDIKKGSYKVTAIRQTQGQTQPPKPLNEATLLTAMESPMKYMKLSSKELAGTLAETGGLGTVATRADIIEKLFDSFYMEKRGKDIFLTSKGRQLLELVPEDLKKPELTAKWEQELTKIAKGAQQKEKFLAEITQYSKKIIYDIKSSTKLYRHDNVTNSKCPNCNKNLLEVKGKKGKMLICQDRECGYKKSVTVLTNARCPNCHKKLELVGEGDYKRFVCVCGHSEKLAAFEERRAKESNQMSKKDLESYLKSQQRNEKVINNPLAEALKGFQFDSKK